MWTLLTAAFQRARSGEHAPSPTRPASTNGEHAPSSTPHGSTNGGYAPGLTNGGHASPPVSTRSTNGSDAASLARDGAGEVRIFMHPGRLDLGVVDLDRADAQFDLRAARAFGSLDEAEPACAGLSGFLLQLSKAGSRPSDAVPAVLFVERLRR